MRKTSPPVTALPLSHCSSSTRVFRAVSYCAATLRKSLSADESAAPFCRIPGSQPECLRHSRRKKSLAGQKDGRHFAAGRETGIFPAKNAVIPLVCSRQAKLPVGNFDAAVHMSSKSPRLAGLGLSRPIEARYLWDILSGVYLVETGRPTPGMLSVNWQRPPKAGGRKPVASGVYGPAA